MLTRHSDPIVAVATAPGRGAVGIVRMSGKDLSAFIFSFFGRTLGARVATYLPFPDVHGQPLDQGLALYFPAPHSFTGEDVLELQAHGGAVVLQLLVARCLELAASSPLQNGDVVLAGLRIAEPGEFTQRAFLNGKLDLAQAEAIADLIDASTEAAARSATQSLVGAFSKRVHGLLDALVHLRMLVEATLDFPEEEIDFLQKADAMGQLTQLKVTVQAVLQQATQGALLREGITVVIAGQPNAGKSSLLNALVGAELAIVTPIAGTTRDKVQETIQIRGIPIHIVDTAGLRNSEDMVEQMGISRAWEAIEAANVVLFLHDLTRRNAPEYIAADAMIAGELGQKLFKDIVVIHVWNKADAVVHPEPATGLLLSAKTGAGLDILREKLLEAAGWQPSDGGTFIARQRHLHALRRVNAHLTEALAHMGAGAHTLDLLAEELRLAQNALSEITGAFSSDDLLGVIFSKFCIGK